MIIDTTQLNFNAYYLGAAMFGLFGLLFLIKMRFDEKAEQKKKSK